MRLTLNGKIPTADELRQDELIIQMLSEEHEKGKSSVSVPKKEDIVQALTQEDLKDNEVVKQIVGSAVEETQKTFEKGAVIESLVKEDLKDNKVVQEMIQEALKQAKFTVDVIQAIKSGKTEITDPEGKKVSIMSKHKEAIEQGIA